MKNLIGLFFALPWLLEMPLAHATKDQVPSSSSNVTPPATSTSTSNATSTLSNSQIERVIEPIFARISNLLSAHEQKEFRRVSLRGQELVKKNSYSTYLMDYFSGPTSSHSARRVLEENRSALSGRRIPLRSYERFQIAKRAQLIEFPEFVLRFQTIEELNLFLADPVAQEKVTNLTFRLDLQDFIRDPDGLIAGEIFERLAQFKNLRKLDVNRIDPYSSSFSADICDDLNIAIPFMLKKWPNLEQLNYGFKRDSFRSAQIRENAPLLMPMTLALFSNLKEISSFTSLVLNGFDLSSESLHLLGQALSGFPLVRSLVETSETTPSLRIQRVKQILLARRIIEPETSGSSGKVALKSDNSRYATSGDLNTNQNPEQIKRVALRNIQISPIHALSRAPSEVERIQTFFDSLESQKDTLESLEISAIRVFTTSPTNHRVSLGLPLVHFPKLKSVKVLNFPMPFENLAAFVQLNPQLETFWVSAPFGVASEAGSYQASLWKYKSLLESISQLNSLKSLTLWTFPYKEKLSIAIPYLRDMPIEYLDLSNDNSYNNFESEEEDESEDEGTSKRGYFSKSSPEAFLTKRVSHLLDSKFPLSQNLKTLVLWGNSISTADFSFQDKRSTFFRQIKSKIGMTFKKAKSSLSGKDEKYPETTETSLKLIKVDLSKNRLSAKEAELVSRTFNWAQIQIALSQELDFNDQIPTPILHEPQPIPEITGIQDIGGGGF